MSGFIRPHMLGEEDPLGPQFPLLPEVLPPPEDGVDPEDPEDTDQEARHQHEGPVKHRFPLRIGMGSMGNELDEIGIRMGMALAAGLDQTGVRDKGFGLSLLRML